MVNGVVGQIIIMNKDVDILRRKPLVAIALPIFLFSICSYHYLAKVDINIEILIVLSGLTIFTFLINERLVIIL